MPSVITLHVEHIQQQLRPPLAPNVPHPRHVLSNAFPVAFPKLLS